MTAADRATLGAYCQAYGRWAQAERALAGMAAKDAANYALMVKTASGNPIHNPLVGIANKSMADMVRYAEALGMTPTSRIKAAQTTADGVPVVGKKAQQAAAAVTAQTGTSWEDILPSGQTQ